eukprot:6181596-Pleurochrysis_carterae.AAC.3
MRVDECAHESARTFAKKAGAQLRTQTCWAFHLSGAPARTLWQRTTRAVRVAEFGRSSSASAASCARRSASSCVCRTASLLSISAIADAASCASEKPRLHTPRGEKRKRQGGRQRNGEWAFDLFSTEVPGS